MVSQAGGRHGARTSGGAPVTVVRQQVAGFRLIPSRSETGHRAEIGRGGCGPLLIAVATVAAISRPSGAIASVMPGSHLPLGPFSTVRPPRLCLEVPKSLRTTVPAIWSKRAATRRVRVSSRSPPMKRDAALLASLCGRVGRRIPCIAGRRGQRVALFGTTVQVSLSNN